MECSPITGLLRPCAAEGHVDSGSVSGTTDNEPRIDELAPIAPAATRKELAPTGVPRTKAVSAVFGHKSVSSTSNRFAVFSKDAHAGSPPWRKDEVVSVPLADFVRDSSKRQIRRIKDHMKAKHVKVANCHDDCRCSDDNREEFPGLPTPGTSVGVSSPGVNPHTSGGQAAASSGRSTLAKSRPGDNSRVCGGQATGKLHTFVKPQPGRQMPSGRQALEKTRPRGGPMPS